RKANSGKVTLENTHPFSRELWGRHWTFAHNGQLRGIKTKLKLHRFLPVGTTDSEHAFCWLLEQISKKYPKPPIHCKNYWNFLYGLCKKLASYGTFNILLSDSKHLFAFCSTKLSWLTRKAPFGQAHLKDADMTIDFCEKNSEHDVISVIATEPLTDNEYWHKMSKNEFHIFKNGVSIHQYRECK
ncbi:MAG: class II glutamine amidotransferase, partial [Gammaproteobacteria bacterium]|nr:class II glutamine amidotransferase [Gammaproteobacteria bacterium]